MMLPKHAQVVIIGAGIAGCSVAYHLTKLGWHEIVVVDQGPLFETGGSTTHAPGLVFQINASKTMTEFARHSVDLWTQMELGGEPCTRQVGSMEVAWTPERFTDLKRKHGYGLAWGVDCHLLTPDEAHARFPLLTDRIFGALYVPSDIQTKATRSAEAMASAAEGAGAQFFGGIKVTGFATAGGRVTAVQTTQGEIETDLVVAATGIWAPKVGGMANVPIPLSPMQHLYAVTAPLPELAGATEEISLPFLRNQDKAMYFRQEGESIGIGSYLHEPLLVDANDLPDCTRDGLLPAEMPFPPAHFEAALTATAELMPSLKDVELTRRLNGIFSFTNDGFPVLGESPQLPGFWSAQAVWITHAGGVGKAVAEWIVQGEPTTDLHECDIRRFHPHALSRPYVRARAAQQYREVYDIIHPSQQMTHPRNLRLTPFYVRQQEQDAIFFENVGWERPQWYETNLALLETLNVDGTARNTWAAQEWSPAVAAEHTVTRERVALFDLTPFAIFEMTGPAALAALQRLAANQMDRPVGSITYTAMLTPRGAIKCDLTVTRLAEERFMIVTGGAMGLHDLDWMESHLPGDGSATLTDISPTQCCIGLWGPHARDLLGRVCEDDLSDAAFPYLTSKHLTIAEVPVLALRISYVGELGWELYAPFEQGLRLWDILWEAGEPHGVIAAGGGAFDSLRLEKGYRLWGQDIHTEYNPYEAGIGFAVHMDKGDFIGREALTKFRAQGNTRQLCCMTLDNPEAVVMGKEPIMDANRVLGYVTSASYGHTIGRGIVYGYLPLDYVKVGTSVDILYFGERLPATVAKEPLYDPRGTKMKA
ncbi:MAG: FAD-dependent oxidoreductase [Caldilineaceae bacterium SB0664_bin_27]|uniref:FAD-dependent oxidoreductase n=1 Tax=Caldilineaceae bacterium SB0664_bin_27 TaxID=2605260 RepID=A0A6B0YRR3_9CHLR|nr:FAD-dependent oxidoreductase [Caldilineaceae bacterium SB0664_bin_27]